MTHRARRLNTSRGGPAPEWGHVAGMEVPSPPAPHPTLRPPTPCISPHYTACGTAPRLASQELEEAVAPIATGSVFLSSTTQQTD